MSTQTPYDTLVLSGTKLYGMTNVYNHNDDGNITWYPGYGLLARHGVEGLYDA